LNNKPFWSSFPGILTALAGVITAVGSLLGTLYSVGIIGQHKDRQPQLEPTRGVEAAARPDSIIPSQPLTPLRSLAAILSDDKMNAMLVTHGFYDKIRNASGRGITHQYEPQAIGDAGVVLDHATGLMWQKEGSDTRTLADADKDIRRLNAERFAGFSDWRLPTLEEAMSLMEPQAYDGFHIARVFKRGVNLIWTADRTSDGRGWVLYFYDGILSSEKVEFNAWVRGVRSAAGRRQD